MTAASLAAFEATERGGVTPDEPWDRFESWGTFDHPHLASRYAAPPYRERVTDAADL